MKYCFGADVGGTTIKLGLFTVDGEILDKWEIITRTENEGESILQDIATALKEKIQEKAIPAHRKRAEVPEPSSYRIFRNIPDHRMPRSMEMFRIFRRAISRMSPLRATVTSMRWDDAAWHTLR